MYSSYGSPRGPRYASASRPFSASVSPVRSPTRRFMSQRMQLTPGSTTVVRVPEAVHSPPPAYSRSEAQAATASSVTSPPGSNRSLTMVARPRSFAASPLAMYPYWSRSRSRSRSPSGSFSRSRSRHSSRHSSHHSSRRSSRRSSSLRESPRRSGTLLGSSSVTSLIIDTARKTSMTFTRLPPGLDKKTAGYWVLALAIFCLAATSALVATLLNRTAQNQAVYDEERYWARNEPGLHLREETRLPENSEFELHFARRKTTKGVTLRKPPFFFVTARPRTRGAAAPYPRTVPDFGDHYPELTETVEQYPQTLPPEVTDATVVTLTPDRDYVAPDSDNSTVSQSEGHPTVTASEGVPSDTATKEIQTETDKASVDSEAPTTEPVTEKPVSSEATENVSESVSETVSETVSVGDVATSSSVEMSSEAGTSSVVIEAGGNKTDTEDANPRNLNEYDDNDFDIPLET